LGSHLSKYKSNSAVSKSMKQVIFTTYADRKWFLKKIILQAQAKKIGFTKTTSWSKKNIPKHYQTATSPYILHRRGGGYWLWKPYVIYAEIQNIKENDILVYLDAGCEIQCSNQGKDVFRSYLNILEQDPIIAFEYPASIGAWTNDATLRYFNVQPEAQILQESQVEAGCLIIKKCPESERIIQAWLDIATNHPALFSDDYNLETLRSEFIDHRHDQSILTLLLRLNNLKAFKRESNNPLRTSRTDDYLYLMKQFKKLRLSWLLVFSKRVYRGTKKLFT